MIGSGFEWTLSRAVRSI